jgi:hypothetical protein
MAGRWIRGGRPETFAREGIPSPWCSIREVHLMKIRTTLGVSLAMALLIGGVLAGEDLRSGPQPGKGVYPFNPLHVNGPNEGSRLCLV